MPTATIDVDTEVYVSAGDVFLQVNEATCDVVSALATAVGSGGGMAGTDSGGVDWAKGYDEAAVASLTAGATLADALGRVGDLLTASGGNHAGADSASTPGGPPSYSGSTDPTASRAAAVLPAAPPSADGTDDDPPAGWFLVAHLLQYVWPNGHQDRLRAVAGGWTTAAAAMSDEADRLTRAIGDVSMLRSPEVEAAVTTCCDVQRSARDLSANYATLGTACSDYADHLDDAHSAVTDELVEFAIESAAIQTASALAAAVTFGAAEVAGQVAQAARTALAATRIGRILQKLLDVVRTVTATIRAVATRIADVLRTVKAVVAKGAPKAVETLSRTIQNTASEELRRLFTLGTPRASQLRVLAKREGWVCRQTATGPEQYYDQNGVLRMTIKAGSARTRGSELPHVEIRNPMGQRIDPQTGLTVPRKSAENHYPIVLD